MSESYIARVYYVPYVDVSRLADRLELLGGLMAIVFTHKDSVTADHIK